MKKHIILMIIIGVLLLILPLMANADFSIISSFDHETVSEGHSITATWNITGAKEPIQSFTAYLNGWTYNGGNSPFCGGCNM